MDSDSNYSIMFILNDLVELKKYVSANPNIKDLNIDGDNIIMYCAAYGNSDTFDYLISQGCSIYYKNFRNFTPLHEACAFGKKEIIHYILYNDNTLINSVSTTGRTILHEVFKYNQVDTFQYLLKFYSKDINALNVKDIYNKLPIEYTNNNNIISIAYLSNLF